MKFVFALALLGSTLPILVAAQCEACEALDKMESCTQRWADQYTNCLNSSCDKKPTEDLLANCQGNAGDPPADDTATPTTTGSSPGVTPNPTVSPTVDSNLTTTTSPNATSSGPKTTSSAAAAPAFGGIGFGGGAAAMVGLAGLVGLAL